MDECRPILNTGLRGFKVASSRISDVDGDIGKIIYRGYLIQDRKMLHLKKLLIYCSTKNYRIKKN